MDVVLLASARRHAPVARPADLRSRAVQRDAVAEEQHFADSLLADAQVGRLVRDHHEVARVERQREDRHTDFFDSGCEHSMTNGLDAGHRLAGLELQSNSIKRLQRVIRERDQRSLLARQRDGIDERRVASENSRDVRSLDRS